MLEEYNTIKFKDKRNSDCQRRIDSLLAELPAYAADYERFLQQNNSIKTRMEYLQDISVFFRYLQRKKPNITVIRDDVTLEILESLNGFDFDDYSSWLTNYKLNKDDEKTIHNSNVTKRRKFASIKSLYHYLYVRERISCNPSEKAILPSVHRKKRSAIRILEDNECDTFLKYIDDLYIAAVKEAGKENASEREKKKPHIILRDKAIIYLMLGTGLRVSELCAIDCANISYQLKYINVIRKEDADDEYESDRVYLSDQVYDLLLSYIQDARPALSPNADNYDALFISSRHARITPRAVEMMVKEYADKALGTGNGITPHKLRATFGTRYYAMTSDLSATATAMNHADISVTARYYLKEDQNAKERVRDMRI